MGIGMLRDGGDAFHWKSKSFKVWKLPVSKFRSFKVSRFQSFKNAFKACWKILIPYYHISIACFPEILIPYWRCSKYCKDLRDFPVPAFPTCSKCSISSLLRLSKIVKIKYEHEFVLSFIVWSILMSPKSNIIGFWVMVTAAKSEHHENDGFGFS